MKLLHGLGPRDIVRVALVRVRRAYTLGFVVQIGVFLPPFFVAADCVRKLIEECVSVGSSNVLPYSVADVGPAWFT